MEDSEPVIRKPTAEDGLSVNKLINSIPELDSNSSYCNLLQCSHFSDTSIIVEKQGEVLGFISGYIQPKDPKTLFIWQVAVSQQARGLGIASEMLKQLLNRRETAAITHLETTITDDNKASWALFNRLANNFDAPLERSVMFDRNTHFKNEHDTELLARIGPIRNQCFAVLNKYTI
ncbi:diaminobutyrate acetyltransferase [Endozoicomonas sp. OPT23]|uniref:diaminobutyrate acetyltransferase n=1 Tax=Endozoicomonas sp. OPT23 TaxID=2072845 RepID=UPI00129A4680|nr:diaminobutyrate acetyltransferase [Endozoicomonas sp. OPT23]MRI34979.1 diaminobutyrate acetyltransferase [Endozoicomonas sp. OPT23]